MNHQRAIELYRLMLTAHEIDDHERLLVSQNLAHFHVSGAGHEASACLAATLRNMIGCTRITATRRVFCWLVSWGA